ncbi:toxin-antitoxin system YwqK family antitoxin [Undibacterium sp. TJN25]|uniref:toxin-antitoxin system YwqK family antitoxin n=1 Tax=Undibacterium sp. TJN25 TaxID=3413056 RepID=UPI003BF45715
MTAICLISFLLQACGSKVDCNDSKNKDTAIEIIQSHLNAATWYSEISAAISGSPALTNIKTSSRNDELKQCGCSGSYTVTYNGKQREIEVAYFLAYLQDKGEVEVKVDVDRIKSGLMGIAMTEAPVKNGTQKILDPKTGNLQQKIEWKNGIETGVEEIFNPANNKLIGQIEVVNGVKSGKEKRWSDDGSVLLIDLNWIDGKANGFQKQFDSTGQKLITDLIWKDGKASGIQTTGNLSFAYDEYHFKDGLYDGVHKNYVTSSTGKLFLYKEENYKDGKLDGIYRQFYDGKLEQEKNYKEGVEVPGGVAGGQQISTANSNASREKCLDAKIEIFHKENGLDAPINDDVIQEWKRSCNK